MIQTHWYPESNHALSIRPADRARLAPCLKKLDPIIQRMIDIVTPILAGQRQPLKAGVSRRTSTPTSSSTPALE